MIHPLYIISGEPRFDRLPVIKLLCSTQTPINARIYAQAQIGLFDESLAIRLWAFETAPSPKSILKAVFESPQGEQMEVFADATGKMKLIISGEEQTEHLTAHRISGEDLQGEYWGAVMMVPIEIFKTVMAIDLIEKDTVIKGNVLKIHPSVSAVFLPLEDSSEERICFGEFCVS